MRSLGILPFLYFYVFSSCFFCDSSGILRSIMLHYSLDSVRSFRRFLKHWNSAGASYEVSSEVHSESGYHVSLKILCGVSIEDSSRSFTRNKNEKRRKNHSRFNQQIFLKFIVAFGIHHNVSSGVLSGFSTEFLPGIPPQIFLGFKPELLLGFSKAFFRKFFWDSSLDFSRDSSEISTKVSSRIPTTDFFYSRGSSFGNFNLVFH